MLDTISKAILFYEKTATHLIEEMINIAQPFKVTILADESWNDLFVPESCILNEITQLEFSIHDDNIMNTFTSKKNGINYLNILIEDTSLVNNENGKIKLILPIAKLVNIIIEDGIGHNLLNNIGHVLPLVLTQKDISEFKNI